jgi:DNA-binding HxlR family transcriptional regulator
VAAQGDNSARPCPISRCADLICGKWTVLVIRELTDGPRYFSDLESGLQGISPRTLCERLKFLTENDVVSRTYIKALPPRTQYELTDKGLALLPVLALMREYGSAHLAAAPSRPAKPRRATAAARVVTAEEIA